MKRGIAQLARGPQMTTNFELLSLKQFNVTDHAVERFLERGGESEAKRIRVLLEADPEAKEILLLHADPGLLSSPWKWARACLTSLVHQGLAGKSNEEVFDSNSNGVVELVNLPKTKLVALIRDGCTVTTVLPEAYVSTNKSNGIFRHPDGTPFPFNPVLLPPPEKPLVSFDSKETREWALTYFTKNPTSSLHDALKAATNERIKPIPDVLKEVRNQIKAERLLMLGAAVQRAVPTPPVVAPPVPAVPAVQPVAPKESSMAAPTPIVPRVDKDTDLANAARALLAVMRAHSLSNCVLTVTDPESGAEPSAEWDVQYRTPRTTGKVTL